jgi:hypothetical protein
MAFFILARNIFKNNEINFNLKTQGNYGFRAVATWKVTFGTH